MSFEIKTGVCLVCHCEKSSSDINPCPKGHYQCEICAIALNDICGICTMPKELKESDGMYKLQNVETFIPENSMRGFPEKFSEVTDHSSKRPQNDSKIIGDENVSQQFADEGQNLSNIISFIEPPKEDEAVSAAMMSILKSLHDTKCARSCSTFERCIGKLLIQLFGEQYDISNRGKEGLKETSLSVLLKDIHNKICGSQCNNTENCLKDKLKQFVEKGKGGQTRVSKHFNKALPINDVAPGVFAKFEELCSTCDVSGEKRELSISFFDRNSNVIRSRLRHSDSSAKPFLPQHEEVTRFPTAKCSEKKDFSLPFFFESKFQSVSSIECPLPECGLSVEDRFLFSHFLENHKNFTFQQMPPNECKLFFIDPSTLESNEISCIATFEVPDIFKTSGECHVEKPGLPIFVMACKANVSDLCCVHPLYLNKPYKLPEEGDGNTVKDVELIDVEVAETIYGVRNRKKTIPVKWACDDILVICPIAPIPKGKSLRAIMTVFAPESPNTVTSVSFCMRSMYNSTLGMDSIGSSDTLFLTSVDISALTTNRKHSIHCQLMCNI